MGIADFPSARKVAATHRMDPDIFFFFIKPHGRKNRATRAWFRFLPKL
jgi:hypothetical protein